MSLLPASSNLLNSWVNQTCTPHLLMRQQKRLFSFMNLLGRLHVGDKSCTVCMDSSSVSSRVFPKSWLTGTELAGE